MSSSCRILRFPQPRPERAWSPADAKRSAAEYLSAPKEMRSAKAVLDPDVLIAICNALREKTNVEPSYTLDESSSLFEILLKADDPVGLFDEREYVLGDLALLSAKTSRLMGRRQDTEQWLDRADSFFRQTVNPAPHLSNVAYDRLALRYEIRDFSHVLEYTLPLSKTFERLGMDVEAAKTLYLRAATLKLVGRWDEAFGIAMALKESAAIQEQPGLLGQVWMEIGQYHAFVEDYASASSAYQQALPLIRRANHPIAMFSLKLSLGESLRDQNLLDQALAFFKSACKDAREHGLETNVAYSHLLVSETLLALGRNREAEWEIYAALPIIQEQSMVPEGLAALTLLKESVARQKTDPAAVKALRTLLQAKP